MGQVPMIGGWTPSRAERWRDALSPELLPGDPSLDQALGRP